MNYVFGNRKSSFLIVPRKAIDFIDDPNDRTTVNQNLTDAKIECSNKYKRIYSEKKN
jgi:hypothetical protein